MKLSPTYHGQRIGIFGLARSGEAAFDALKAAGANVVGFDDRPEVLNGIDRLPHEKYDLESLDLLVLSPGVPLTHPKPHAIVERANQIGLPICGDFDLFLNSRDVVPAHKLVGITGTNGKSTTTALIGHIITNAGHNSRAFGNIGVPFLAGGALDAGGVYVAELSSFQIDLSPAPVVDIGILLNLSPDHLDRHGSMEGYAAAKAKMFTHNGAGQVSIISCDDAYCRAIASETPHQVVPISVRERASGGVYSMGDLLIDDLDGKAREVFDLSRLPTLKGAHNYQNCLAAYAAGRLLTLAVDQIVDGLMSFGGLVHRQEQVANTGDLLVINDSKATNWDSAQRALQSFDRVRWIAGGRSKGNFGALNADSFVKVHKAYLYGEAADDLSAALPSTLPRAGFSHLSEATKAALLEASHDDTVLLSPAATAFDQFKNFEERGTAFKQYVKDHFDEQRRDVS